MIYEATPHECSRIAQDLQIRKVQVESVVQLLNEGNTIPFITRYRKERTGGLDEDALRAIQLRLSFLKHLNERKQTILKSIDNQGKLTDELRHEILNAPTVRRLEDLYLPFKPKKKSLALAAREKGLEPLALAIWYSDPAVANLDELLPTLVNPEKQLSTVEDVRTGAQHILAELINETAEVRAQVRRMLWKTSAIVSTRNEKAPEGQGNEYKAYFQFKEPTQDIRPHRILALNRGEKESILRVKLEWPAEQIQQGALGALAEHLRLIAGRPVPTPKVSTPTPIPETLGANAEATPSVEQPAETPAPTAPAETTTVATAPLVDSLSSMPTPVMTGESLLDGVDFRSPHTALLKVCLEDALNRLLFPSLEREIRNELTDEAELHAVKVFAHNIRSLLMQPPLMGRRVLAIDPGFRTGCKLAALDEFGNLLDHLVIFPHGGAPGGKKREKKQPEAPVANTPDSPAPEASAGETPSPSMEMPVPTPAMADATTPTPEMGPVAPETPVVGDPGTPSPEVNAPSSPMPDASAAASPPVSETTTAAEKRAEAKTKFVDFVQKHNLNIIAIGNGTACRETEEFVAEIIAASLPDMTYVIVSEAGASVYSISPVAKEEFPNLDATVRSGASIGRRLQDPLSELVKIDPQSLGVGLYQHDMGRRELREALEAVVESCVNQVGVDVNTASVPLLRYVSGLNQLVAREIVEHRKQHGPFTAREQLVNVTGMGPTRYVQAAGFLKITNGVNPLDRTWIHPESYALAEKALAELGGTLGAITDKAAHEELRAKMNAVDLEGLASKLETSVQTLDELFMALARPGRDPREELPPPIFKKGILKLEDLQPGLELKGTVLNVVDFGAFVDVGLKESGLVHISQMANKYIKSPYDVVSVNDIVRVWVLKIDKDSNHVSLTMIQPGSERKPEERGPRLQRQEGDRQGQDRGQRLPQRDRGPGGPPREGQASRQGQGGRPPQRRSGPPPRRDAGPPREAAPPQPPPPPSKPRREPPKPKLTQAAIEGKAPLRSLGELAAFFAAKEKKDEPAPVPQVVEEKQDPSPETPTSTPPAQS